jgi:hypothetical protein
VGTVQDCGIFNLTAGVSCGDRLLKSTVAFYSSGKDGRLSVGVVDLETLETYRLSVKELNVTDKQSVARCLRH